MLEIKDFFSFLNYFIVSVSFLFVFTNIYKMVTRYDEVKLIKENNMSAAIAYSGSVLGFILPLASSMIHSINMVDYIIWATISLVLQLLVYVMFSFKYSDFKQQIENNNAALSLLYAVFAFGIGIVNATAISY